MFQGKRRVKAAVQAMPEVNWIYFVSLLRTSVSVPGGIFHINIA